MQNGHVEDARERLGEQRLAGAGRPDEQDVRLLELDLVDRVAGVDPLVVVVDGDREDLLGPLLADDVLVERELDLARVRELGGRRLRSSALEHLLFDDLLAEVDALVADVDALARDELADLLLALAAEGAAIRDLGSLGAAARCVTVARPGLLVLGLLRRLGRLGGRRLGFRRPPSIPRRRPGPASWACAISELPSTAVDRIDDAIVLGLLGRHEIVPVRVLRRPSRAAGRCGGRGSRGCAATRYSHSFIWMIASGAAPRNPPEPWWIMIRLFGRA